MRYWILCGAGLLALGAGVTYLVHHQARMPPPQLPAVVQGRTSQERVNRPTVVRAVPAPQIVPVEVHVVEQIVTRPEPFEGPTAPPILIKDGGAEESEAGITFGPRFDQETRRMPYADDRADTWVSRFFGWSGLSRLVSQLRRTEPEPSGESEEPPVIEDFRPDRYHPPHCPYSGQCPYPYQYRNMQPR
jgi:hypothetical protein